MSNFRAEGYGNLAALNFIYRTWTFHAGKFDTDTKLRFVCDNNSLINRKAYYLNRITNRAKDCSENDHDIILAIERILRDLPTHRITDTLVKSN